MKKKVVITVSIVIVGLVGLALAGGSHLYGPKSPAQRIDYVKSKLADVLDLTEMQKVAVDRMAEDILAEHGRVATRRGEFKARILDVLNQERVSPEDFTSLFEEKKPDIDRIMQLAAEHLAEFHSILTPEQRALLITEMENHHSHCRFGGWQTSTCETEGS